MREAYDTLCKLCESSGENLRENRGGDDAVIRELDCAVIETLHETRREDGESAFDTVRGLFPEGEALYEKAGFRSENHIQICVRNRKCIKGYFRPIED